MNIKIKPFHKKQLWKGLGLQLEKLTEFFECRLEYKEFIKHFSEEADDKSVAASHQNRTESYAVEAPEKDERQNEW